MPGAPTIIVVEDHPATLAVLVELLETAFPGCALLAAGSAEHALHLCTTAAPQIVIMDIALPGMSGIEATRRIKASFPDTRVVMHSSYDVMVFRGDSVAAGASAFVPKSRAATELVPVVSSLLPAAAVRGNHDFPTA